MGGGGRGRGAPTGSGYVCTLVGLDTPELLSTSNVFAARFAGQPWWVLGKSRDPAWADDFAIDDISSSSRSTCGVHRLIFFPQARPSGTWLLFFCLLVNVEKRGVGLCFVLAGCRRLLYDE